jgi:predicted restriction endonuclease
MLLSKRKFDLPIRRLDIIVVDPPKWIINATYNKREMYNYLVGTPETILTTSGKIAQELNTRYILVHYRNMVQIEEYTPIHVIKFKWFARYLNTENRNTSLYILYERKNIE